MNDENDILLADKHQRFLQIHTITLGVWHAQITENMKFAISFQDLKKEVSDEVDFCVYISMSLLHIDTMILIGMI